jgi:hypothetical protein
MPLLSPEILHAALAGLEAQKARLESQIAEVRALMGRRGPGRPPRAATVTGTTDAVAAPAPRKRRKKRTLSPEGRAAIIAAVKRRWAAKKKAAK